MDISSLLTSSQIQQMPNTGTKVATDVKTNTEHDVNMQQQTQQSIEQLRQISQRRVEQTEQLEQSRQMKQEQLEVLVDRLDEFVSSFNKGLSFRLDEESGRNVVTIYEKSSGDIIRQIPDEDMLDLVNQLSLYTRGILTEKV